MNRQLMAFLALSAAVFCERSTDAGAPNTGSSSPSADAYRNMFAVWDAEGQHLSTEDILAMHKDYAVGIYFFRDERKHDLQLKTLKQHGLILVKTAHPGYEPFSSEEFLSSPDRVRGWAREAAAHPFVDGLALDIEMITATTHADVLKILSAEARKQKKLLHAVPHFCLFERFSGPLTPDDFNHHADIVWPWLYNRFRQPEYKQGLMAMMKYWTDKGVRIPVYPIFDHGRVSYSGITPAEAADVPGYLAGGGVSTVCLFQPHASYRELRANPDYRRLWSGLRDNFGSRSSSRPSDGQCRASSRPSSPDPSQSR